MLERIDHIGIAVDDLEKAIAAYRALGLELGEIEAVPEQQVNVAMFPCGESRVELLESTSDEGPIARFIQKKGPGMHHVAFAVDDIDETVRSLTGTGVRMIDESPRDGADGARIAFIHPSSTGGVLVEICQRPDR